MKKNVKLILAIGVLMSLTASSAMATVECSATCPEGEVMISFLAGNSADCSCVPASEGMAPNTLDENNVGPEFIPGEGDG